MTVGDDVLGAGAIGSFTGVNVYRSYHLERGQWRMSMDLGGSGTGCVFEGLGLLRGVAYTAPDVERGYLVSQSGSSCVLLDASTGKIVAVHSDEAVEIEERYRSKSLADAVTGLARCPGCGRTWGSIEAGHGHFDGCPTKGAPPR